MLNTYLASRCLLLARRSRKHSSHKRGRESATFPLAPRQNKKPPIRWSRTTDSIRIKNINTQLLSASCFVSFSIPNFHRHDAHGCRAVDRSGGNFRTAPSCSRHGSCLSLDYDRTGSAMNIKADGGYMCLLFRSFGLQCIESGVTQCPSKYSSSSKSNRSIGGGVA